MIPGFQRIKDASPYLNKLLQILFSRSCPVNRKLFTSAPTTDDIEERELAWFDDGTNRRIYTKLEGNLYKIDLTAV